MRRPTLRLWISDHEDIPQATLLKPSNPHTLYIAKAEGSLTIHRAEPNSSWCHSIARCMVYPRLTVLASSHHVTIRLPVAFQWLLA